MSLDLTLNRLLINEFMIFRIEFFQILEGVNQFFFYFGFLINCSFYVQMVSIDLAIGDSLSFIIYLLQLFNSLNHFGKNIQSFTSQNTENLKNLIQILKENNFSIKKSDVSKDCTLIHIIHSLS